MGFGGWRWGRDLGLGTEGIGFGSWTGEADRVRNCGVQMRVQRSAGGAGGVCREGSRRRVWLKSNWHYW